MPNLQLEPNFDELLAGPYPYRSTEMPKERPLRLHCFIARDAEYYSEMERLKQAVVMHTVGFGWELSVDNVCDYACRTKLVTKEEIQVSQLYGSRFLIMLPEGLAPDTFINATPQEAWDEGLSFQPWTPLDNAAISIPAYKILINLVDIPPPLFKEKYVAQAVSCFGVFLGSVASEKPSSIASWTVAVGVDDLSLVPPELVMHVGGMVHTVQVHPIACQRAPIYTVQDIPKHPKTYYRPQPPPPSSSSSSDNENNYDDSELIPMSSGVLRDLCRGKPADSLPPELRRFATIEERDLDGAHRITQDSATLNQPAQSHQFPNLVQSDLQSSADRLSLENGVAGLVKGPTAVPRKSIEFSNHIQSHLVSSVILQSKETTVVKDANLTGVAPETIIPVTNPNILLLRSPQQPLHAPNPRKILLRGEPSKTKGKGIATKSAPIKRNIPSANEKISKAGNKGIIIAEKVPESQGFNFNFSGHMSNEEHKAIAFSAKEKGQAAGPSCGPNSRRFKWTRPVPPNSAQVTKKIIAAASHKRKNPQSQSTMTKKSQPPLKKRTGKGNEAEVSFNADGFYEVQVQYDHVAKLATGCGFNISDVHKAIASDNDQRRDQASALAATTIEEEETDPRFELDPNDELTSEEEEA